MQMLPFLPTLGRGSNGAIGQGKEALDQLMRKACRKTLCLLSKLFIPSAKCLKMQPIHHCTVRILCTAAGDTSIFLRVFPARILKPRNQWALKWDFFLRRQKGGFCFCLFSPFRKTFVILSAHGAIGYQRSHIRWKIASMRVKELEIWKRGEEKK